MSVGLWIAGYAIDVLFCLWIVQWGGARWLENSFTSGFVVHWLAPRWSAEGIRAFVLLSFVATTIWFIVGLLVPEARGV
jgi:hypothetical protein